MITIATASSLSITSSTGVLLSAVSSHLFNTPITCARTPVDMVFSPVLAAIKSSFSNSNANSVTSSLDVVVVNVVCVFFCDFVLVGLVGFLLAGFCLPGTNFLRFQGTFGQYSFLYFLM